MPEILLGTLMPPLEYPTVPCTICGEQLYPDLDPV